MAAERDTVDRYLAAWLSDRVGATFQGRVSGVQRFGLFVKLDDSGADGLVPIREVGREFFHFDPDAQTLMGADTGLTIGIGARVTVRLREAVPVTGGLILELIEIEEKSLPSGRAARARRAGAQGRGPAPFGPPRGAETAMIWLALALLLALAPAAAAQTIEDPEGTVTAQGRDDASEAGFRDWVADFRPRALEAGLPAAVFDREMRRAEFLPKVVERDRRKANSPRRSGITWMSPSARTVCAGGKGAGRQRRPSGTDRGRLWRGLEDHRRGLGAGIRLWHLPGRYRHDLRAGDARL